MKIELMTKDPETGKTYRHIWDAKDIDIARDYFDDAKQCNYEILIWRLLP